MKQLLFAVSISLFAITVATAQIPKKISYQGVLTTPASVPVADGQYTLQFRLFDSPTGGTVLFEEEQAAVQVHRGTFKALIGSESILTLPFDRTYYLELTVSAGPGIGSPITFPRSEFSSVPYALRADTAQVARTVIGGGGNGFSLPFLDTNVVTTASQMMFGLANKGTGFGAFFVNDNSSNPNPAIVGKTNGTGYTLWSSHEGTAGNAGFFDINNATNSSAALYAHTIGNGAALEGQSDGTGPSVKGTSSHNYAIAGYTDDGTAIFGSNNNSNTLGHAGWFNGRTRVTQDLLVDRYIGIGSTTPATRLDVLGGQWDLSSTEGDMRIGNANYRLKLGIATGGGGAGDARIRAQGGVNRLSLGVNTSDLLTLYNNQVGIGTLNPSSTLHIADATNPTTFALGVNPTSGGYTALLTSLSAVSGGYVGLQAIQSSGSSYGNLVLNKDGGNVGIGTPTPSSTLEVYGNVHIEHTGALSELKNFRITDHGTTPGALHSEIELNYTQGTFSLSKIDTTISGIERRILLWNPHRSSFVCGYKFGTFNDVDMGEKSIAMGNDAVASGSHSVAIGTYVTAQSQNSFALGTRILAQHYGSFVIADNSAYGGYRTESSANNQMTMRFTGGYRLFTNMTGTVGVSLAADGNSWSSISDSTKKENYRKADGEHFLSSLSKLKLGSWNYKMQDAKQFRHYGPMAQEIFHYFGNDGIGTIGNDTTLSSADMDGIIMICLQALEKRTTELQKANETIENMMRAFQAQQTEISELKNTVHTLLESQTHTSVRTKNTGSEQSKLNHSTHRITQ